MSAFGRLVNLFRQKSLEKDFDEELAFHLDMRGGKGPSFGNRTLIRERMRDAKTIGWVEDFVKDMRYAVRGFRRNPVALGAAVFSLSVALGAVTAVFMLIEAMLFRPLDVRDPATLVQLWIEEGVTGEPTERVTFNYPLFTRLREAAAPVADLFVAGYIGREEIVIGGSREQVYFQNISGNAFQVLGVQPVLGRTLTADDDRIPGAHPFIVLSYDFWTRRFGRDASVLGRTIVSGSTAYQIIGVTRQGFTGTQPGRPTEIWAPAMMKQPAENLLRNPGWHWFGILGRVKPGASLSDIEARTRAPFQAFRIQRAAEAYKNENPEGVRRYLASPLKVRSASRGLSSLAKEFARPLWFLAIISALVLLTASANVANLLLARGAAREREFATRISLGAGRGRLVRQILTESCLVGFLSALCGLIFALQASPWLTAQLAPESYPVRLTFGLQPSVLAFVGVACTLLVLLFGLPSALRALALESHAGMRPGERVTERGGFGRLLVGAQAAFSCLLLITSALCLLSLRNLTTEHPGFDQHGLTLAFLKLDKSVSAEARLQIWEQLLQRMKEIPEFESAGLSRWSLFTGGGWSQTIQLPGSATDTLEHTLLTVLPGFFDAYGTRLLAGRDFRPFEAKQPPVRTAIVNEAFAKRHFNGANPVGRIFLLIGTDKPPAFEIVGMVEDARYNTLRSSAPPMAYFPASSEEKGGMTLAVRSKLDLSGVGAILRREIPQAHPGLQLGEITTLERQIDDTLLRERLVAKLSVFFGAVALLLTSVGLFGLLSYYVARRTRDIGIRMALGARAGVVIGLVLRQVTTFFAAGLALGAAGAAMVGRWMESLLYGVRPLDAFAYASAIAILALVSLAACLAPAIRAARVNPVLALRTE